MSDNNGQATQLSISHRSLDSLLAARGVAGAVRDNYKWIVEASNTSGKINSTSPFKLGITRFGPGLTAFTVLAPLSSTNVLNTNPSSTTDFFNFRWQRSTAVPATSPVTYKVVFVKKSYDA